MIRMPRSGVVLRAVWCAAAAGAVAASLASRGVSAAGPAVFDWNAPPAPPADTVSYKEDVLPIFQKRCAKCHGGTNEEGEVVAEVSLIVIDHRRLMMGSEFGPVITAGDPEDSWLLEMIAEGDMPPEGEGDKVPEEEIAVIRQWILEGAKNN